MAQPVVTTVVQLPEPSHWPAVQGSASISLQPTPCATGVLAQPLVMSQKSAVQSLASLQVTVEPLVQAPLEQTSPLVHASLSSQALASLIGFDAHAPVEGSQAPWVQSPSRPVQSSAVSVKTQPVAELQLSVVQRSLSSHVIALPPPQFPPEQVSPLVHASPSSHALPSPMALNIDWLELGTQAELQGLLASCGSFSS